MVARCSTRRQCSGVTRGSGSTQAILPLSTSSIAAHMIIVEPPYSVPISRARSGWSAEDQRVEHETLGHQLVDRGVVDDGEAERLWRHER